MSKDISHEKQKLHKLQNKCKREHRQRLLNKGWKTLTSIISPENHEFLNQSKNTFDVPSLRDSLNIILNHLREDDELIQKIKTIKDENYEETKK